MESFASLLHQSAGTLLLYTLILIFTISLVVFVHEMGHYLSARLFKVRVRKFSLGFGREILGRTDKTGMRWSLSLFPLGGYVELFGYDSAPDPQLWDADLKARRPFTKAEKKEAFCFKPLWQRAIIVAAGPLINFALAFLILCTLYFSYGQGSVRPVIYALAKDTAAHEAGLQPLDEIIALDGKKIRRFEDVWEKSRTADLAMVWTIRRGEAVFDVPIVSRPVHYTDVHGIERAHGRTGATNFPFVGLKDIHAVNDVATKDNPDLARVEILKNMQTGQPFWISFTVSSEQGAEPFLIFPVMEMNKALLDPADENYSALSLQHSEEDFYIRHGFSDALWYAGAKMYQFIDESLKFLRAALSSNHPDRPQVVGGLVSMGKMTGEAAESGWYMFMMMIAVLSVQIGFINLLPIPVLDGGYLLFFLYEAIRGKALPAKVQDYALSLGLIALIGIMVFANLYDVLRIAVQP